MKGVFEKIIEKLEHLLNNLGEHCEEYGEDKDGRIILSVQQLLEFYMRHFSALILENWNYTSKALKSRRK